MEVQPWVGRETRGPVARLRWVAGRGVWQLFCLDGKLTWHRYGPLPDVGLDVLVRENDLHVLGLGLSDLGRNVLVCNHFRH